MMEITIATIGRLTKKSGHGLLRLPRLGRRIRRALASRKADSAAGFGLTTAAFPHFLQALHHDLLAWLQAFVDHPQLVHARPDLHVAERHLVALAHDRDAVEVLQLGDRSLRDEEGARLRFEHWKRARPYCPGADRRRAGLGNVNWTARVPVVGSTARSMASTRPVWG